MRREFPHLLYETRGRVATIMLNRPQVLNACNYAVKHDLLAALELAAADTQLRVLAIRGAGRAFCAGIDLKELSSGGIDERNFELWERCLRRIETMDLVSICLLHGYALGSGIQIGLACDLRVATPGTKIGLPAGREGLIPGLSVWRLARFIGMGRAKSLAIWGDSIDGEEAMRIGLVSALVSEENRDAEFDALLERTVAAASWGVRATRLTMNLSADLGWEGAFATYMEHQKQGLASADFREAMSAYREKREPVWT
ncbi:MAG: enoyl-CoA hydratase/isomerase family protein [Burkholderiales bacterium]